VGTSKKDGLTQCVRIAVLQKRILFCMDELVERNLLAGQVRARESLKVTDLIQHFHRFLLCSTLRSAFRCTFTPITGLCNFQAVIVLTKVLLGS
jgi:hypothetical protein